MKLVSSRVVCTPAPTSFHPGKVYTLADVGRITEPCPPERFLRALKVRHVNGIVTGNEILAAMERRAEAIRRLPLPEAMPKTRRTGSQRALEPLNTKRVIATRKSRH